MLMIRGAMMMMMMMPIGSVFLAVLGSIFTITECVQPLPRPLPDVLDYFPEADYDASSVSWAHGVNSRDQLDKALDDNIMMLEADVSFGYIMGKSEVWLPVMAHPPATFSNITLKEWIEEVLNSKKKLGIKLDFKTTYADSLNLVEDSLKILQGHQENIHGPLWLNADVLPGPVNASATHVDPEKFIRQCRHFFPASVLSLGWTTTAPPTVGLGIPAYSWHHVIEMDKLLHQYEVKQRVSFPVRAMFVGASYQTLKWLTDVGNKRSLTVWSSKDDEVTALSLYEFWASFDRSLVYFDLPSPLREQFWAVRDRARVVPASQPRVEKLSPNTWVKQDGECARAGSEAVVFFGNCLAMYMEYYHGTVSYPVTISGILEFGEEEPTVHEDVLAVGLRSNPWMWVRVSANGSITYQQESKTVTVPPLPASHCYGFKITDSGGKRPVRMHLSAVTCSAWDIKSDSAESTTRHLEVDIPPTMESTIQVAVSSTGKGIKVLHSLRIHVPSGGGALQPVGILVLLMLTAMLGNTNISKA